MATVVSERIADVVAKLIEERRDNGEECNPGIVANDTGIGIKRFENCRLKLADFKASEVQALANYFNHSVEYMYSGEYDAENRKAGEATGLSNDSLRYLEQLNSDKAIPFVASPIDGGKNNIALSAINRLLSTESGHQFLYRLGLYFACDFKHGMTTDESVSFESVTFLAGKTDAITIPVSVMRSALLSDLESIAKKIVSEIDAETAQRWEDAQADKGGRKNNGKRK